jgi:hypothetical protein
MSVTAFKIGPDATAGSTPKRATTATCRQLKPQ